jgi:hypothetical protein
VDKERYLYRLLSLSVLSYSIFYKACGCEMTHSWLREQLFHDLLHAAQKMGCVEKNQTYDNPIWTVLM